MAITQERLGQFLREALRFLAAADARTRPRQAVIEHLTSALHPTEQESIPDKRGYPLWRTRFLWNSVGMVKAGWLTKDGYGIWSATESGVDALERYPDAEDFRLAVHAAYTEWEKSKQPAQRRAWLVRGSSVAGENLVPEWLTAGFCSLAATYLPEPAHDVSQAELESSASEGYSHLPTAAERQAAVDEIVAFVEKMNPGDVVLTTADRDVYVGDVTGDWTFILSDGGLSNLRRTVDWRNEDAPLDEADLPDFLVSRFVGGALVADLTTDLAVIDDLIKPEADDDSAAGTTRGRHEHLSEPSAALADELFVSHAWLSEVRELLDERRQVIFHGPPGTGKTYIARKLAADLVGSEQVKLVQFHPAYTYEDFFEGYRPAPGTGNGTISFELKPGPLRKLVNRARQHPDQAFVLIIDEINRANLAKVFGELYFLLEYRDQAVDLLYSTDEEGFTLPRNLYMIGTMNTADRSIALIDGAMRRRFAFVELSPDTEPTRSLLAKWSKGNGLPDTASRLLTRLNERIDDPDFRIGPSYFMKVTSPDAFSEVRLERIWRSSILPLLQEHHYGEWEGIKSRYQLSSLLAPGAGAAELDADPLGEAGPEPDGHDEITPEINPDA